MPPSAGSVLAQTELQRRWCGARACSHAACVSHPPSACTPGQHHRQLRRGSPPGWAGALRCLTAVPCTARPFHVAAPPPPCCPAGLVSITGSCAVVAPWAAVVIGGLGGCFYTCSSWLLRKVRRAPETAFSNEPLYACTCFVLCLAACGLFPLSRLIEEGCLPASLCASWVLKWAKRWSSCCACCARAARFAALACFARVGSCREPQRFV